MIGYKDELESPKVSTYTKLTIRKRTKGDFQSLPASIFGTTDDQKVRTLIALAKPVVELLKGSLDKPAVDSA